jgi:3-isopropylmalate/(R)-2-methylmalate dehydratase small subunit
MSPASAEAGRAWLFGDNIDTDVLAPGRYMKAGIEEIARHCLEAVDPSFAREVRLGDVVVGGRNFGAGSSREQAPQALKQLGVAALVAESFAGLFYRNALNLGLPALVCGEAKRIRAGDRLRVDPQAGRIDNLSTGETIACEPIPAHLMQMIRDGGLLPHLEKRLAREGHA